MFIIQNAKRSYNCYLSENNEWKGLLEAKTFKTKDEITNVPEDGKIVEWNEVVGLKSKDN